MATRGGLKHERTTTECAWGRVERNRCDDSAWRSTAVSSAPPQKSSGKKTCLIVAAAFVGLIIVIGVIAAASGGKKSSTDSGTSGTGGTTGKESSSPAKKSDAKLGEAVRDGKLEFTATNFACGKSEIASPEFPSLKDEAQGQFCTADFTIKNTSDKPVSWLYNDQKLVDNENRELDPDFGVIGYLNGSNWADALGTINPGVSVSVKIAWDVAKDGKFTFIEVHDSPLSNGARIGLT